MKIIQIVSLMLFTSCSLSVSWGAATEYPLELRIFHFPLVDVSPERARWLVDTAKEAGFNAVQIIVRDGVSLDKAPWRPDEDSWSNDDLVSWIDYTKKRGFLIIPEIKLLTHQEKFFQSNYPHLLFNSVTYDPRQDETYDVVFDLIDEIIQVFDPRAIHIGHDEVKHPKRNKKKLKSDEKMLPAELYLMDVIKISDYLRERKIDTWMWGDMLISSDEFPTMLWRHPREVGDGYGKELRTKLPRDIVICDWHYHDEQEDFPSLSTFKKEGFRVIGVTWDNENTIRNFGRYAIENDAYGMMATLWFHVRRKEFELVEHILQVSGDAFHGVDLDKGNSDHL